MRTFKVSRGNATLEFTLVGIPLVFVLISTFEMARGMWIYHTLAHAVKEGTRYTIVRGQNNPIGTYQGTCNWIVQQGAGLVPSQLSLTFHSATQADVTSTADKCSTSQWPPGAADGSIIDNQMGQAITITGYYPFQSALAMFWPGSGSGINFKPTTSSSCNNVAGFCFPAASEEVMQF